MKSRTLGLWAAVVVLWAGAASAQPGGDKSDPPVQGPGARMPAETEGQPGQGSRTVELGGVTLQDDKVRKENTLFREKEGREGPAAEFQKNEVTSPYIDIPGIGDEKFGLLLEAIFNQEPLDFPSELLLPVNTGTPWQEWKADFFKLQGDIDELILRFEYSGELTAKSSKASSYYLSVKFEEYRPIGERITNDPKQLRRDIWRRGEGIVIKHNLPKKELEADGVRIGVTTKKQHRVFIEGRDQTGVVAIVPKVTVRGVRGLLVCARDYDIWKFKSGYAAMENTGHELVGVEAIVSGSAQAKVNTGFGPGLARATLQVSPNVFRSREFLDESRVVYPYASVMYSPVEKARPLPEHTERVTAGIKLQTTLINSLEHKTVSTGTVVMTIKKVDVKKDYPLTYKNINFRVKSGSCYAILKESKLQHLFVKEKLPPMEDATSVQTGVEG